MNFRIIVQKIVNGSASIGNALSWVSSVSVLIMITIVFANVIGRYFFRSPIIGTSEIVETLLAILGAFAMFYTATRRAHIRIDLFLEKFSAPVRKVLDVISSLTGAVTWAVIAYQVFQYGYDKFNIGEVSIVLHIPVGPFVILLSAGLFLYSLVLLTEPLVYLTGETIERRSIDI